MGMTKILLVVISNIYSWKLLQKLRGATILIIAYRRQIQCLRLSHFAHLLSPYPAATHYLHYSLLYS